MRSELEYFGALICRDVSSLSLNYTFKWNISKTLQWWLWVICTKTQMDGWRMVQVREKKKELDDGGGGELCWKSPTKARFMLFLMLSDVVELHVSPLFYFIFTWTYVKSLIFPRCRRMQESHMSLESYGEPLISETASAFHSGLMCARLSRSPLLHFSVALKHHYINLPLFPCSRYLTGGNVGGRSGRGREASVSQQRERQITVR